MRSNEHPVHLFGQDVFSLSIKQRCIMGKKKPTAKVVAKPKTYVAIILDKSGSMAKTKNTAISGFNEQVQQLKEDSKTQEIYCSLVTFNADVFEHLWNVPAEKLSEANAEEFQPGGSTAMRDAVGYTVQKLLNTTDHEDPNVAYLIVTISDGETNIDRHYNWEALKELTQGCEATKKWTFTYMGCTKEYMEQLSRNVGTQVSNMAAWSNHTSAETSVGFSNMRGRQAKYFAERSMGQTAASNYASDSMNVADFTESVAIAAPAPVVVDVASLPKVDIDSVLSRQPKYQNQDSPAWNGGPLFTNSMKVAWSSPPQLQVQCDLAANHGAVVPMAAMPVVGEVETNDRASRRLAYIEQIAHRVARRGEKK